MSLVLVVDDEPDIRFLQKAILKKAGHEVTVACHGQEALEQVANRPPDLIITDRNMPVMNGLELIERLRKDPKASGIPILLLTAGPETVNGVEILTKPFNRSSLTERVHELLGRAAT